MNENGVKSIVVQELAKSWPVNVSELHRRVEAQRRGVTYHAVYKAVSQLKAQGILAKNGGKYSISPVWVSSVSSTLDGMKRSYIFTKPLFLPGLKDFVQEGETKTFIFENLEKADEYKKRLQWEYLMSEGEKKPYCAATGHLRSPLFASERSLSIMTLAEKAKSQAFVLVEGDTPVDRWCADYYRTEFVRVQTGIHCAESCETAVLGNIIVQIYIPDELKLQIEHLYSRARDMSEVNMAEFLSVYRKPAEVRLVAIRNTEIAQQLRSQILANFRMERLAVFDVNGTLVEGFLVTDFAEYFALRGLFGKKPLEEIRLLDRVYKEGRISFTVSSKKIIEKYAEGLANQSVEVIQKAAEDFVDEGRIPLFTFSKKLFNMVNSYCTTLVITKGTPEIAKAFHSIFPYDHALTSILKIKNGKYTGKVSLNLASRGNKEKVLKKWLGEHKAGLKGSFGFGDSHHDLSFLEKVEFPFVVKPTRKMKKYAMQKRWKIYFEKPGDESIFADLSSHISGSLQVHVEAIATPPI